MIKMGIQVLPESNFLLMYIQQQSNSCGASSREKTWNESVGSQSFISSEKYFA